MSDLISALTNAGSVIAASENAIAALQTAVAALGSTVATDTAAITSIGSQLAAIGQQLANRGTVSAPGTTQAGATNTATATAPSTIAAVGTLLPWRIAISSTQIPKISMPTNPGDAPIPSPDGIIIGQSIGQDGTVIVSAVDETGAPVIYPPGVLPYLRDQYGTAHQIVPMRNSDAYVPAVALTYRINNWDYRGGNGLTTRQASVWEHDGNWLYEKQTTGTGGDVVFNALPVVYANGGTPLTTTPGKVTDANGADIKPSPEYCSVLRYIDPLTGAASLQGAPYLWGSDGHKYSLDIDGHVLIDGVAHGTYHADQIIQRQGMPCFQVPTSQWQYLAANGSNYNRVPPPGFIPGTSQVPMAPLPPAPKTWGGTSGRVLNVGAGQAYATINAAHDAASDGDTVLMFPGTYPESIHVTKAILLKSTVPATIAGADGRAVANPAAHAVIASPDDGWQGKGAVVLGADGAICDGFEVTGAGLDQKGPDMCCGVRADAAGNFKFLNVLSHGNQMGFGADALDIVIEMDTCVGTDNGIPGTGGTHDVYFNARKIVATGSVFDKPPDAHCFKVRAAEVQLRNCRFADAVNATLLDVPNGSGVTTVIDGCEFDKPAGAANHDLISYATEGATNGTEGMALTGCTLTNDCAGGNILITAGTITLDAACKFPGSQKVGFYGGGVVVGLPG